VKREQQEEIEFLPATKAARALGMSLVTLRQFAEAGKIEAYLTPGGKWRYNVRGFLRIAQAATKARCERKARAGQMDLFEKGAKDGKDESEAREAGGVL